MPSFVDIRAEYESKSKQLSEIFSQAGADMNMDNVTVIEGDSHSKATEIRKRNEELTDLRKQIEAHEEFEKMRESLAKERDELNSAPPPPTGSGEDGTKSGNRVRVKSLGQLFVESDAFRKFSNNKSPEAVLNFDEAQADYLWPGQKALFTTGSADPEVTRTGRLVDTLFQRLTIEDLIPEGRTNQGAIKYMEETVVENGAAAVAEGQLKPESALEYEERISPVRKIATVLPVTDEAFEDEPQMRSIVENRLRLFMRQTIEAQLLSGNGTAPNLRGILSTNGIQTQDGTNMPVPDAVFRAMTKVEMAFMATDGIVFHPLDWQDIRLLRTDDGIYIWGSPTDAGPERIWGLPVVKTISMPEGEVLVGAFEAASQKFRRNELSFSVSDSHADFFQENKLMLRVEQRLALVVYRPPGFVVVENLNETT